MLIEYFKLAFRNVGKRKKRMVLTMAGIFVGIAAIVALVSLGQGLQGTINAQFEKIGGDKILVQASSAGVSGEFAPGALTKRELDLVDNVNGVVQTAGYLFKAATIKFNNVQRTVFMISLPDTAQEAALVTAVGTWAVDGGRLLSHKDSGKVVVGYNLAHNSVFGKNVVVGDKVVIGDVLFDVVGVLKRSGDPGMDGGIIVSESDARSIARDYSAFSVIVAQSGKGVNPDEVAGRVKKAIRRDRHQKDGAEDFSVQTLTELIESFNAVFNIIQVVFVGVAAISLVVGSVGIVNVMFTAVLERTREIGVMKAIGARNQDVLLIFLIESGLLGFSGGAVGVALGVGLSKGIEFIVNGMFGAGTLKTVFPVWLVGGVILFSLAAGVVSGVLPARRAALLKPVDALRYE